MRFLLVLAFATVALAGTVNLRPASEKVDQYVMDLLGNDGEIEYVVDHEDGTVEGKFSWNSSNPRKKFNKFFFL